MHFIRRFIVRPGAVMLGMALAAGAQATSGPVAGRSAAAVTITVSSPTSATVGAPVTATAKVTGTLPANSSLAFYDGTVFIGSAPVNSGLAYLNFVPASVGVHSLKASYPGSAQATAASSTAVSVTATPAPATVALSVPASGTVGTTVTETATVSTAGSTAGTVTFFDGSNALGSAPVSGNSATFKFTPTSVGVHGLKAVFGGNSTANSSSSSPVSFNAAPIPATITLAVPSTGSVGTAMTGTATIKASGAVTGTVSFYDGTALAGTANVSGSTASFQYVPASAGAHTLTASYSGNASLSTATSAPATLTVLSAYSSIAVSGSATVSLGTSAQLTAKVSLPGTSVASGLVTFYDNNASLGAAPLSAGSTTYTFTPRNLGAHSIVAKYAGSTSVMASASVPYTVTVGANVPTVQLTAPASVQVGAAQTLSGSVTFGVGTPGAGTYALTDNGMSAGTGSVGVSGVVTASWTPKTTGKHILVLNYSGDGSKYAQSSSSASTSNASVSQTQMGAPTVSPTNPQVGATVTITVPLSGYNPTGTVTFKDNGLALGSTTSSNGSRSLGTALVNNVSASINTTFTTSGSHFILVSYAGDSNNQSATSQGTITVAQAPATLVLSASSTSVTSGTAVNITAKLSNAKNPTGKVTFSVNGASSAAAQQPSASNGGIAIGSFVAQNAGTYTVVANYSGDATTAATTSNTVSITAKTNQPSKGPQTGNGIQYNGGNVMAAGVNVYFIWYGDWSTTQVQTLMPKFISELSGSSYWHIMTTYADSLHGNVTDSVTYMGSTTDNYSQSKTINDGGVAAIVQTALQNGTLPTDPNGIYFVMGGKDVKETTGYGSVYCGWHSSMAVQSIDIAYGYIGNPQQAPSQCGAKANPAPPHQDNGVSDAVANTIAHEMAEAATDKDLTAWYVSDPSSKNMGMENGDLCAWNWITVSTGPNSTLYNVQLGNDYWLLQGIWLNAQGGKCALNN